MKTSITLQVEVTVGRESVEGPSETEMAVLLGKVLDAGLDAEDWDSPIDFDTLTINIVKGGDTHG